MSLIPIKNYHVRVDEETGDLLLCLGNMSGDFTVIGTVKQHIVFSGQNGNLADVTVMHSVKTQSTNEIARAFSFTVSAITTATAQTLVSMDCTAVTIFAGASNSGYVRVGVGDDYGSDGLAAGKSISFADITCKNVPIKAYSENGTETVDVYVLREV